MISSLCRPHMRARSQSGVSARSSLGWMLLLLLPLLLVRVSASPSITASPTNDTLALTQNVGNLRFILNDTQTPFSTAINLAPLLPSLAELDYRQFQDFQVGGDLIEATPSNTASITPDNIALISCDPSAYSGYLDVAETISDVVSSTGGPPAAIILYSTSALYCNITINDPIVIYTNAFTILNATSSQAVLNHLASYNGTVDNTTVIVANMSTSSSATGYGNNSQSTNEGDTTSSSTTAVAMIILYTITGIITALFLGIIVTGAVRAHRHPERYGPRNITGRPRQSRARGIARAMLETIPIVKFGDSEENVAGPKRDLEMASRNEEDGSTHETLTDDAATTHAENHTTDANGAAVDGQHVETVSPQSEADAVTNAAPAAATTTTNATTTSPSSPREVADLGNNVCPICTDDFVKGQDVRLLPCSHQFHPDCIDPWLINVSGTCPLCRINLNPASAEAAQEEGEHEEDAVTREAHNDAAENAVEETRHNTAANRHSVHRGLAGYLSDIRRTRNASVEERIAALRRLQASNVRQDHVEDSTTPEENQGRRRLATRLRERFRIRTRQHDGPPSASTSAPALSTQPQPPSDS